MAHIILPIATTFIALGKTINITKYDLEFPHDSKSIFNDTGYEQTRTEVLNAVYHVLPGDELPASAYGYPVDIVLRHKTGRFQPASEVNTMLGFRYVDSVTFLVVAEYVTAERSLKKNAVLVPGWQKNIAENSTHYVEKLHMGSSCFGQHKVKSTVNGDLQIIRKILTDIMGTSRKVEKNTIDLWKKAWKAIEENPDIRGKVTVSMTAGGTIDISDFPQEAIESLDSLLNHVPNLGNYVDRYLYNVSAHPSSVSYRQLYDLDKQFPVLKKNAETEEYLEKLDYRIEDLKSTGELYKDILEERSDIGGEVLHKLSEFQTKTNKILEALRSLSLGEFTIYKELSNKAAFQSAFKQYENGLENGTKSYYTALKKLTEDFVLRCENDFLEPTSGLLKVQSNEVIYRGYLQGNLTDCQEFCEEDHRCRSVGYIDADSNHATLFSGKGKMCWIFYRSTDTATIYYPDGFLSEVKLYDRICQ